MNLRKDHYRITPNISMFEVDMWIDWSRGEKNPQPWRGKKLCGGKNYPLKGLLLPRPFFSLSEREGTVQGRSVSAFVHGSFSFSFFLPSLVVSPLFLLSFSPPFFWEGGKKKEVAEKELLNVCAKPFYPNVVFFSNKKNIFLRESEKQLATVDL